MDDSKLVRSVFLEISKAFDLVSHDQFDSLLTDRRALLFERLQRATGGQNHCLGLGGVKC